MKHDADDLVGYFSLGGNFSQLAGLGLHTWDLGEKWKAASSD